MPKKILLLLLLLLVGCSQQERLPGYLYLRLGSDPTTLDPAFIVDASGGSIAAKLYDGLVGFDQAANIVPGLARSWEISPDGRVYTFHVRRDVKFSNGRMLTASDFKYSFERVLDPAVKSPRTWLFDRIAGAKDFMAGKAREVSGIRVLDGCTLEITLDAPFGPFLGLLGGLLAPGDALVGVLEQPLLDDADLRGARLRRQGRRAVRVHGRRRRVRCGRLDGRGTALRMQRHDISRGLNMRYTPDLVEELNVLLRFNLTTTLEGLKVHHTAAPEVIEATKRLHDKGLITKADGGYLTDLGHVAADHAQDLLGILTSD